MKVKILEILLNESGYISGENIANQLGISRTAVWKNIKKLKDEGYGIDSVSNKGYRLSSTPDKLIKESLKIFLKDTTIIDDIYCYDTIGSTNKEAKKLGMDGVKSALVISEEQTSGKGRRGRAWVSSKGTGIYMTLLLSPSIKPEKASLLTLLTGLAIRNAIEQVTGLEATIKWPNDIIINGKKVCGILTEMSSEIDAINYVIIGMGINVNNQVFNETLDYKATSIEQELKQCISRQELIKAIIEVFEKYYYEFLDKENLEFIMDQYNRACVNVNRTVRVIKDKKEVIGVCKRIKGNGALVIEKDDQEIEIKSGEVSVRGLYGYV